MAVFYILLFITGCLLGSFYNVVGLRMPKGESIVFPSSHCVNCNHKLSWYELIPVFSYIFLHGKCSKCKIHISWQYPIVEFCTGVLFVLGLYIFGFSCETLIFQVVASIVMITIVSDYKYMVILDEVLIIGGILLIIITALASGPSILFKQLLSSCLLFLVFLNVKILGDITFKQESLGWGDVKLSLIAGFVLGFKLGLVYIFLASFIALPYALYQTIKKKTGLIPFGPFLAISLLIILSNRDLFLNAIKLLVGV